MLELAVEVALPPYGSAAPADASPTKASASVGSLSIRNGEAAMIFLHVLADAPKDLQTEAWRRRAPRRAALHHCLTRPRRC